LDRRTGLQIPVLKKKNPRKHLASFGLAYWTSNPCSKKKKLIGIFRSGVLDYQEWLVRLNPKFLEQGKKRKKTATR
jgi:hypothetical protein